MNPLQARFEGRSTILGVLLATVAWLGTSAIHDPDKGVQRVLNDPHPVSVVRILEGTPYTVPDQHMLTVKSIGQAGFIGAGGTAINLNVNDINVLVVQTGPNPVELGAPIVAAPTDVVTVHNAFSDPSVVGVALGYLTRL